MLFTVYGVRIVVDVAYHIGNGKVPHTVCFFFFSLYNVLFVLIVLPFSWWTELKISHNQLVIFLDKNQLEYLYRLYL